MERRQINQRHDIQKESAIYPDKLAGLRLEIDAIDDEILTLLSRRMNISKRVGEYKRGQSISPLDSLRWRDVINSRIDSGKEKGLEGTFVVGIYNRIHEESLKVQKEINDKE